MSLKLEEQTDTLPNGWRRKPIREICEIGGGKTPRKSTETYWGGEIPWVSSKDFDGPRMLGTEDHLTDHALQDTSINRYSTGDIVMVVRSGVLKHSLPVAILEIDAAVNQDIKVLQPDENRIDEEYLLNALLYESDRIRTSCIKTGTTVQSIEMSFLKSYKLPIPPLEEQRRIAEVLSTVDEKIRETEEIIETTEELKRGLVNDLIYTGIEREDTRQIHIGPKPVEIAQSWETKQIGEVTTTVQYGSSESLSQEGQYPMFRMNNIERGWMVPEPMKYVDLDDETVEKYRVERGDILFNRTNSIDLVGKSGIFDLDDEYVFASYLIRLQTNEQMNPWYLNYFINSKIGQDVMFSIATRGASQANINATNLKNVHVPAPPREEQDEIVDRIRAVERKMMEEEELKEEFQQLKRGLMQDLLTGEIRTPESIGE